MNEKAFDYYPQLKRVREYVEKHYTQAITLREASAVACMEMKYFSAFFRHKVGIPFRLWLTQFRVAKAMQAFQASNHSVTDVAFAVGFQDLSTFERAFRRHIGQTPLAFKKTVRPC